MRAAASFGRQIRPLSRPKPPNAGTLWQILLTPRIVNEFVTLAVTHPVDGHAGS
jgi:hypothetical protein